MNQKEKLIELVGFAFEGQENDKYQECDVYDCVKCVSEYVANYLIANGVVVLPCHCGGCEHHHWEQDPCHGKTVHYCSLPHMRGVEVYKDFFCAYAKKKTATKRR